MNQSTLPRTNNGRFQSGFIYSPETLFQPGLEAQNKGKKFPGCGNRESFTKGHLPHNTLHDEAITVRKNNSGNTYMYIRLAKGKWEFLQKHNWIQKYGPIPQGKVLACKNGDTLNADPSNWELITRGELANRNRLNRTPKIKACEVCGKSYETIYNNQKYCSDDCQKAEKQTIYAATLTPVNCLVCGAEFVPNHQHTKICSRDCRLHRQREFNRFIRDSKPIRPEGVKPNLTIQKKTCVICQATFQPTSNVQKTCSEECRTVLRTNFSKQYKLENPVPKNEKHCARCGENFTVTRHNLTICPSCKTNKARVVKCIECGTEFSKSGKGAQLLCSHECKLKRKNKLRAKYGFTRKPFPIVMLNCALCNNEFEARNGSKYCSATCKRTAKNQQAKEHRDVVRVNRPADIIKPAKQLTLTCTVCGSTFTSSRKQACCSEECRKMVRSRNSREYNRKRALLSNKLPPKPHKIKQPKPEKIVLNRRNPKAEKDAVYAMLELNRNAPKHDREAIEKKNIVSPDLASIEFRHYDKRLRITRFFNTKEKYLNYLKNN